MLALVRSANDSASDVAIYNSRAHGFICKAPIQREKIMEIIAPIWAKRFAERFPHSIANGGQPKSDVDDTLLDNTAAHRFDADAKHVSINGNFTDSGTDRCLMHEKAISS